MDTVQPPILEFDSGINLVITVKMCRSQELRAEPLGNC